MGNALRSKSVSEEERQLITDALQGRLESSSPLVLEHIEWALEYNLSQ
jgi:hypothetical protein